MILVASMFLLAPVGVALYLYVSGVRPFRFVFYILLLFFALTVGIGLIQYSYEGYDQTDRWQPRRECALLCPT